MPYEWANKSFIYDIDTIKWYERLTLTFAVSIVPSEDVISSSTFDNKWPFGLDVTLYSLQCRRNDHDGVSNHQPHGYLLNRLFRSRLKKTSKLRVTGLCVGNSPGPVNSPHKGPVTRKCFHLMTSSWKHPLPHLQSTAFRRVIESNVQ